jgi:type IV pilus assembly protein PilY1
MTRNIRMNEGITHPETLAERSLRTRPFQVLLAVGFAALMLTDPAVAGQSDLALFSTSSGAPPNVMLLLDDSGSMEDRPSWCSGGSSDQRRRRWRRGGGDSFSWRGDDPDPSLDCREKWEIMRDAAIDLVQDQNPANGDGTYDQKVRFGLFMFDDDGNGGMLIESIADDNTEDVVDALRNDISTGGATPLGASLVDIGRYFAGSVGYGTLPKFGGLDYAASSPFSTEQTVADIMDLSCRENYVIALSDGEGQTNLGSKYPNAALWATIGDADGDGDETVGTSEEWFDDTAYDMFRRDFRPGQSGTQNITVHTVAFDLGGSGATLLENAATYGGGTYFEANASSSLEEAFEAIAQNIFTSLGSFTGATVSSSRTNQGDLFINSYFEPKSAPVWNGHLEAFRVAPNGDIQGVDTSATPPTYVNAIDSVTKLVIKPPIWDAGTKLKTNTSRRIITPNSAYTAMINLTPANVDATSELDILVGDAVEYPNYPASGVDTLAELEVAVIDYVRGKDAFDEDNDSDSTEMRDFVLGDIFHSTPIMIGPPTTFLQGDDDFSSFHSTHYHRNRAVYAGANDGLLHSFDAGDWKTGDNPMTTDLTENGYYAAGTGVNAVNGGKELFGFVPRRMLDEIATIPLNDPRIRYYMDGSPTAADAWLGDKTGGTANYKDANEWATVLIAGMREGGRGYVALDITDPASAGYPGPLWEFSHANLGFTWSKPVVTRVKVAGASGVGDLCGADDGDGDCVEQWVAVFGGGYEVTADPNDTDWAETSSDAGFTSRSKSMYIVSLDTGVLLAKVELDESGTNGPTEMKYAIPGSPSVLDLDFDGFADVVYMGDVGGQVWKWDIEDVGTLSSGEVTNWPAGVFFRTLPTTMSGGVVRYRSFFHSPAATFGHNVLTLAFGSGEREDLFYMGSASHDENNRFYVVRDYHPTGSSAFGSVSTDAGLVDLTDGTATPGSSGYYIKIPDGEKFVAENTVFAGFVIATSFTPQVGSNSCTTASGQSFIYIFDLASGVGVFDDGTTDVAADRYLQVGGGMPSAPKVSMGEDPTDDVIYIKTSSGQVIVLRAPPRSGGGAGLVYWRQVF